VIDGQENCPPNCFHFQTKIAHFGLNYRILKEIAKNNISGRKVA